MGCGSLENVTPGAVSKHLFLTVLVCDEVDVVRAYYDGVASIGEGSRCVD